MKRLGFKGWAIAVAAVAYVILPVDLLPDFWPLVGWIDDVMLGATAAYAVWRRLVRKKGEISAHR